MKTNEIIILLISLIILITLVAMIIIVAMHYKASYKKLKSKSTFKWGCLEGIGLQNLEYMNAKSFYNYTLSSVIVEYNYNAYFYKKFICLINIDDTGITRVSYKVISRESNDSNIKVEISTDNFNSAISVYNNVLL